MTAQCTWTTDPQSELVYRSSATQLGDIPVTHTITSALSYDPPVFNSLDQRLGCALAKTYLGPGSPGHIPPKQFSAVAGVLGHLGLLCPLPVQHNTFVFRGLKCYSLPKLLGLKQG